MILWLKKILPASTREGRTDVNEATGQRTATEAALSRNATNHKNEGNALLAEGRLVDAAACYRHALASNPDDAASCLNLGFVLKEQGLHDEAEHYLVKAASIDPTLSDAHFLLGAISRKRGNLHQAIERFDRALELKPGLEIVYGELCQVLFESTQNDRAKQVILKGIALNPESVEFHFYLGNLHLAEKTHDQAIACFLKVLALHPGFPEVHSSMGVALEAQGKLDAAVESYRMALSIRPDDADIHCRLGNVLRAKGELAAAVDSFRRALSLKPNHLDALFGEGNALLGLKRHEEAVASYDQAVGLRPNFPEALSNRGSALLDLGRHDAALASLDRALQINANYADALYNRGNALWDLHRHEEALADYQRAVQINPEFADAHLNEGLCRLVIGDLELGWSKYEWRWQTGSLKRSKRHFEQPLWLGKESLQGKTILLHFEQGFGDTIQFCRYAKLVAARGATVLLQVPTALRSLLAQLEGPARVIDEGETLPSFDYHCPLLSLPLAFKTSLRSIPADPVYLRSDPDRCNAWRARLGDMVLPRIGLVWSGRPEHHKDHNRSIPLTSIIRCVSDCAQFVSLQKDMRPADAAVLAEHDEIVRFGDELKDFAETAALVANMDLVISVDTAVAHLACAMGRPVWLLLPFNPDSRWLLERHDSPWYPSATLFRQPAIGDWDSVISMVASEIATWVEARAKDS